MANRLPDALATARWHRQKVSLMRGLSRAVQATTVTGKLSRALRKLSAAVLSGSIQGLPCALWESAVFATAQQWFAGSTPAGGSALRSLELPSRNGERPLCRDRQRRVDPDEETGDDQ